MEKQIAIQVYVKPDEKLKIEKLSKQIGLSASSYLRSIALSKIISREGSQTA